MNQKINNVKIYMIGGLITAIIIGLFIFIAFSVFYPANLIIPQLTPVVTIIVAPSPTTGQSTQKVTLTPVEGGVSQIKIGEFVQIFGTGTEGLRFRADPSLNGSTQFIGMESEVFKVENGPVQSDNYQWWYLRAPYDKNRSGWVVSEFLILINTPTP
jgi:hypothetical protein